MHRKTEQATTYISGGLNSHETHRDREWPFIKLNDTAPGDTKIVMATYA